MTRKAFVAGRFYPGDKKSLGKFMSEAVVLADTRKVLGAVVPHAGYMYSGVAAGAVYSRIEPQKTYVIISPNHTGHGADFSVSTEKWETPLGIADVDEVFIKTLLKKTDLIVPEETAHLYEHSVEVQIPFIQWTNPKARIVPITVHGEDYSVVEEIGRVLAETAQEHGPVVIVASSDMTHYEPRTSAQKKDKSAIEKILKVDAKGLYDHVRKENISMCGYVPVSIMLNAVTRLGAKHSELICYTDSGEVTGDTQEVVGYAGMILY